MADFDRLIAAKEELAVERHKHAATRAELAALRGDGLETEVDWYQDQFGNLMADCGVVCLQVNDEGDLHGAVAWDGDSAEEKADSTEDAKRKAIAIARLRELERQLLEDSRG